MLSTYRVYRYDRLDAPAISAGTGAVLIGAQSGLFPDMGVAVPGEMGGLWAGEIKVCDGFFVAVDDVPLVTCDAYEAHPVASAFHYRMQKEELHVVRRQYIPDGLHGCVVELTIENLRSRARMAETSFTVRSELLTVAAANGEENLELGRDVGEYDEHTQAFYARESRNPWHAVWGADNGSRVLAADLPDSVYGFGNTQGKGINGRLFYRVRIGANAQATMRLFVAGGFASQSKAEDELLLWRERADLWYAEKEARVAKLMEASEATLPDNKLSICWNWSKIYADWLYRELPRRDGCGLRVDLPEHPALFGEGWAAAVGGLLPIGAGARAQAMLRTIVRLAEKAQLAPGRVPKSVSLSGKVMQVGGEKESAEFVTLVQETLLWTGDLAFAKEMLPMTGLCVSYLRRASRGFADVKPDMIDRTRKALLAHAAILRALHMDDAAIMREAEGIPEAQAAVYADTGCADAALAHGAQDHVEQMIGCLGAMAKTGLPGIPGALRRADAGAGVMLQSRGAAGFVWPMISYLFGVRPNALERTVSFAPHTPIGWDGWALERLHIGDAEISISSERVSPSKAKYTITCSQPGWIVNARGAEKTVEGGEAWSLVMED